MNRIKEEKLLVRQNKKKAKFNHSVHRGTGPLYVKVYPEMYCEINMHHKQTSQVGINLVLIIGGSAPDRN